MFDEAFLDALAERLLAKMFAGRPPEIKRWPEIMNVETAGEYMNREPAAIRKLVEKGILPACRIDGRVQVRRVDIDRIAERKTA